MPVRRLGEQGLAALTAALGDPGVLARYRAKIVAVPGSECLWWAHAVSGRGQGRFWLAPGRGRGSGSASASAARWLLGGPGGVVGELDQGGGEVGCYAVWPALRSSRSLPSR